MHKAFGIITVKAFTEGINCNMVINFASLVVGIEYFINIAIEGIGYSLNNSFVLLKFQLLFLIDRYFQ